MEDQYKYVQAQLKRRAEARQLAKVASETKVSRRTIGYIMEGKNAHYSTVDTLYKFLKDCNVKYNASSKLLCCGNELLDLFS